MISRFADERGLTLTELLVAVTLMLIISAAALTTLEQLTRMTKRSEQRLDQQDKVRNATREIARALRNVAASPERPDTIEQAGDYDIVFKAVVGGSDTGANSAKLHRVRYCLDSANRNAATLRLQTQTWATATPPAIPSTTSCPSTAWGSSRVVAQQVTNRAGTNERPVFNYRRTSVSEIESIAVKLYLDDDPSAEPAEAAGETGVFLRNQNRAPVAHFTATTAGVRHILLNASESVDPENQPLDVRWYDGGVYKGSGVVFDYYAKTGGAHQIELEVKDLGGLVNRSSPLTVVVP